MWSRRTAARILVAAVAPVALVPAGAAAPAYAHGAPDYPVSRTYACAPDGPHLDSAACQAAIATGGPLTDWDYLRVAGVAGQDREVVPDGALCSGGLPQFAGLDLARSDWPTTDLTPGAEVTFTYRTTIPHLGTFRLYLTRGGYDPEQPLRWADLAEEPFATVTDPPVADAAYQLPVRLPEGVTGRHLILTIWQNSDNPDTYYSCSDVRFPRSGPAPESAAPTGAAATSPPAPAGPTGGAPVAAPAAGSGSGRTALVAVALAVAGGFMLLGGVTGLRRSRRPGGSHRQRPAG